MYIFICLLVNKLMTGLQKLHPTSKDHNNIRKTQISAINSALASNVLTEGLQSLQANVLCTNQLLEQQNTEKSINSLWTKLYLAFILWLSLASIKACKVIPIPQVQFILSRNSVTLINIFSRLNTKNKFH